MFYHFSCSLEAWVGEWLEGAVKFMTEEPDPYDPVTLALFWVLLIAYMSQWLSLVAFAVMERQEKNRRKRKPIAGSNKTWLLYVCITFNVLIHTFTGMANGKFTHHFVSPYTHTHNLSECGRPDQIFCCDLHWPVTLWHLHVTCVGKPSTTHVSLELKTTYTQSHSPMLTQFYLNRYILIFFYIKLMTMIIH